MTSKFDDYRRYFIVDGRHVGDYEGMYRHTSDPWRIEELGVRLDMRSALLLLELCPPRLKRILDAGAGAGLFTLEAARVLAKNSPGIRMVVSDISPTALDKATQRLSGAGLEAEFEYTAFDLRDLDTPGCPWPDSYFEVIILAQVLWSLMENIDGVFSALAAKLVRGGHLLMSQHFFPPEKQQYAAAIINGPSGVEALASKNGFKLIHTLETDRGINHHWAALWTSN
ncbi:MAG: class I SAM-dependent methyltransferase [Deltaproteobacteria bacterium]|jgi:2-polyprenyl-3-methyl-5-hydroxy-6-metoxy-1,4-benzoquinol methylase|nr:class I SAM-dependent methyltransferase [Deltaproteobacteria bacterium]